MDQTGLHFTLSVMTRPSSDVYRDFNLDCFIPFYLLECPRSTLDSMSVSI